MGLCQWAEMGPKVGFGVKKMGQKWVETHFSPTSNPFRDFRENPLFSQFKGGGNCFLKRALKQSRPSIRHNYELWDILPYIYGIFLLGL